MKNQVSLIMHEKIERRIFSIRGKQVMLDRDLAILYRVETKALNQAVRRNLERFPSDFMFQLSAQETKILRSQFVTLRHGEHSKYSSYAFTEHGILMLSSVLNSDRAIEVNIQIMRTFAKIREMMVTHKDLRQKIEDMEQKYDNQFQVVFKAIKRLIDPPVKKPKIPFGFAPPVQK